MSSFKLSINGPSLGIGLFAFMLFRSAVDPIRIPPLNKDPAKLPIAATPALAKLPIALPIPYVAKDAKVPPIAPAIAPNNVENIFPPVPPVSLPLLESQYDLFTP